MSLHKDWQVHRSMDFKIFAGRYSRPSHDSRDLKEIHIYYMYRSLQIRRGGLVQYQGSGETIGTPSRWYLNGTSLASDWYISCISGGIPLNGHSHWYAMACQQPSVYQQLAGLHWSTTGMQPVCIPAQMCSQSISVMPALRCVLILRGSVP